MKTIDLFATIGWMTVVTIVIGALLVLLASCATAEPAKSELGIEAQRLSEEERAQLECARKLQAALAERNPALGAEYQQALADKIVVHDGKPAPVDYGPVCQKLEELQR